MNKMKNNLNATKKEELEKFKQAIKALDTPDKIQDFISSMPCNFEEQGETCMAPASVLKNNKSHCIEGAFFAAACIWINKIGLGKPLVVDMKGEKGDWDHVIAVFQDKKTKQFGAISKTNHSVLRYREPVYNSIRELIMSYFHEYTDDKGKGRKTLRAYSDPIDLSVFGEDWITSEENLWHIHDYLDSVKHYSLLNKEQIKQLRNQEQIEIDAGQMTQFKR
jgi:hypothetical protein